MNKPIYQNNCLYECLYEIYYVQWGGNQLRIRDLTTQSQKKCWTSILFTFVQSWQTCNQHIDKDNAYKHYILQNVKATLVIFAKFLCKMWCFCFHKYVDIWRMKIAKTLELLIQFTSSFFVFLVSLSFISPSKSASFPWISNSHVDWLQLVISNTKFTVMLWCIIEIYGAF